MRSEPRRVLDLFCKAGGAAMGLHRAWPQAEIVGVDIEPQKRYPFTFVRGDALTFPLDGFDFIWASPPCQAHTALKTMWNIRKHVDLIPQTRKMLIASGIPWAIENVPLAPLRNPITLCGSMFSLKTNSGAQLRRHRLFETSFSIYSPGVCAHTAPTIGIYGDKARDLAKEKRHYAQDKATRPKPQGIQFTLQDARDAMECDWMNMKELSQAIPPAYSEYIARQYVSGS